MDRKLNVLVEGESLVFSIRVALADNASDLKKAVHQDRGYLQSVLRDHQKLAVSKVGVVAVVRHSQLTPADPPQVDIDLTPYITDVDSLGLLEASNGQLLQPWETVSHHWPNQQPDNHLHVIVKLPATGEWYRAS